MLFSFSSACPVRAAILFRPKTSRAGGSRAKHAKNSAAAAVLLTDTPTFFWRRNQSIPAFTRVPSLRFASFRFKIQVANLFRKNFKQICNGPISKLAASRMNERVKTLRHLLSLHNCPVYPGSQRQREAPSGWVTQRPCTQVPRPPEDAADIKQLSAPVDPKSRQKTTLDSESSIQTAPKSMIRRLKSEREKRHWRSGSFLKSGNPAAKQVQVTTNGSYCQRATITASIRHVILLVDS